MVKMAGVYLGEKRCKVEHEPSKTILETDAPKDNQGRGESFSPTDLVAAAVGTCILTTLAIVAERDGVSILNSKMCVEKEMSVSPRRIASIKTIIELPQNISEDYRRKLEAAGKACPVKKSLHADVNIEVEYRWVL